MTKTIIISLGGSIIVPNEIDVGFLKSFRKLILNFVSKGNKVIIVCGGGALNKKYNAAAKATGKISDIDLDWLGIAATKMNAELVRAMFGSLACEKIVNVPTEKIKTGKKIIVASGWKPGWSSDYDAVLLAAGNNADEIYNLTNIDHVYDKDPKKFKNAKKFESWSWKKYISIIGGKWSPRMHSPFDPIASQLAMKKKIKVHVVKGTIGNIKKVLAGKKVDGTILE